MVLVHGGADARFRLDAHPEVVRGRAAARTHVHVEGASLSVTLGVARSGAH